MKRLLFLTISIALCIYFPAPSSAQDTGCGEKDYSCQLKAAMKRLSDDPKDINNYYNVGVIFQKSGNCKEAIETFDMFLLIGVPEPGKMADAYNNRGVCYSTLRQYDPAIADYTKAIGFTPKDPKVYVNRGNAYRLKKDIDQALANYNQAIGVSAAYAPAYVSRGHIYSLLKDDVRALEDFNKAIEIDPGESEAYYNRGTVNFGKAQYAKALPDFDRYIALGKASPEGIADGYQNRGICHLATGNPDKAVEDMNKVVAIDPTRVNSYKIRAMAYKQLKKDDLAAADEKKAAELEKQK